MKYYNTKKAVFIDRPNRFIANCIVDGKPEVCHVINTGRMKELTVSGAGAVVCERDGKNRKTKYDLIALEKDGRLINIDSQAPNTIAREVFDEIFDDIVMIKPECKYKNSRFDFYIKTSSSEIFVEVKGVTLRDGTTARFPDAPTKRGEKHVAELIEAKKEGYDAYVLFIVKMEGTKKFSPNRQTNPEFADMLIKAENAGVKIIAYECSVTQDEIHPTGQIPVDLKG